jgi:signal transduction histidine kinase
MDAVAPRRSAALVALEIGQALLFGALLAITAGGAILDGSQAALPASVLVGIVFAAGLLGHRRFGRRGREAWVLAVLACVHLLTLISPGFVWLVFPAWLLVGQVLALPLALGVGAVSVVLVVLVQPSTSTAAALGPLVGAVVAFGLSRGVILIEAEAQRTKALLAQVVGMQAEAARLSDEAAEAQREAGVQAERARLARDIHDTLAQGFSSILLLARAGLRDADAREGFLKQIARTASENLGEARRVVHALAPDELTAGGLAGPLAKLAASLEAETGASVTLDIDPDLPRLTTATEVALLRAAQGVLANVRSHADARHVAITLAEAGDEVRLDVVDDGRGFDPAALAHTPTLAGGYGIRALRERLRALGGGVDIESEPGGGTAVSVHLPQGPRP